VHQQPFDHRQEDGAPVSRFVVLEVWQEVTGRRLSQPHRDQFLQRDEVEQLARFARGELAKAGRAVREDVAGRGTVLRLDRWINHLTTNNASTVRSGTRLKSHTDLLSPDLLGQIISDGSERLLWRYPEMVKEILKYSRYAIREACTKIPPRTAKEVLIPFLLHQLRKTEQEAARTNYDVLYGRSKLIDDRTPRGIINKRRRR